MAYSSRRGRRSSGYSRAPARRAYTSGRRRNSGRATRTSGRRPARAPAREIRLVIEGAAVSPVSRWPGIANKIAPPPRKAKL